MQGHVKMIFSVDSEPGPIMTCILILVFAHIFSFNTFYCTCYLIYVSSKNNFITMSNIICQLYMCQMEVHGRIIIIASILHDYIEVWSTEALYCNKVYIYKVLYYRCLFKYNLLTSHQLVTTLVRLESSNKRRKKTAERARTGTWTQLTPIKMKTLQSTSTKK